MADIVNAFDRFVNEVVDFVENLFSRKKLNLDEFAKSSSKEIDKIILKKITEGNEFIAGRFKLMFIDDKNFCFSFDVYLKHPTKDDYTRLNGASKPISVTRLQDEAYEELKRLKEISYEIDEPESDKYSQIEEVPAANTSTQNPPVGSASSNRFQL